MKQDTLPNSTYEALPLQVPGGHFLLVLYRQIFLSIGRYRVYLPIQGLSADSRLLSVLVSVNIGIGRYYRQIFISSALYLWDQVILALELALELFPLALPFRPHIKYVLSLPTCERTSFRRMMCYCNTYPCPTCQNCIAVPRLNFWQTKQLSAGKATCRLSGSVVVGA